MSTEPEITTEQIAEAIDSLCAIHATLHSLAMIHVSGSGVTFRVAAAQLKRKELKKLISEGLASHSVYGTILAPIEHRGD